MERQPDGDHSDRQAKAGHAGNGESDRGGNDIIDLDARVATELVHEKKQSDELRAGEQQRRGDVVDAVGQRRQQRDRHQQQVGDDQRHIGHAVEGEHAGIDCREQGDQQRHGIDDLQPPADGAGIAASAELDNPGQRAQMRELQRAAIGHATIMGQMPSVRHAGEGPE